MVTWQLRCPLRSTIDDLHSPLCPKCRHSTTRYCLAIVNSDPLAILACLKLHGVVVSQAYKTWTVSTGASSKTSQVGEHRSDVIGVAARARQHEGAHQPRHVRVVLAGEAADPAEQAASLRRRGAGGRVARVSLQNASKRLSVPVYLMNAFLCSMSDTALNNDYISKALSDFPLRLSDGE